MRQIIALLVAFCGSFSLAIQTVATEQSLVFAQTSTITSVIFAVVIVGGTCAILTIDAIIFNLKYWKGIFQLTIALNSLWLTLLIFSFLGMLLGNHLIVDPEQIITNCNFFKITENLAFVLLSSTTNYAAFCFMMFKRSLCNKTPPPTKVVALCSSIPVLVAFGLMIAIIARTNRYVYTIDYCFADNTNHSLSDLYVSFLLVPIIINFVFVLLARTRYHPTIIPKPQQVWLERYDNLFISLLVSNLVSNAMYLVMIFFYQANPTQDSSSDVNSLVLSIGLSASQVIFESFIYYRSVLRDASKIKRN